MSVGPLCSVELFLVPASAPRLVYQKPMLAAVADFLSRYLNDPLPYIRMPYNRIKCVECVVN